MCPCFVGKIALTLVERVFRSTSAPSPSAQMKRPDCMHSAAPSSEMPRALTAPCVLPGVARRLRPTPDRRGVVVHHGATQNLRRLSLLCLSRRKASHRLQHLVEASARAHGTAVACSHSSSHRSASRATGPTLRSRYPGASPRRAGSCGRTHRRRALGASAHPALADAWSQSRCCACCGWCPGTSGTHRERSMDSCVGYRRQAARP
jgi:hypothetical protein